MQNQIDIIVLRVVINKCEVISFDVCPHIKRSIDVKIE